MENELVKFKESALAEIGGAKTPIELDTARVKYLGRAGLISKLSESMRDVPKEERPRLGKLLNEVRLTLSAAFEDRVEAFAAQHDVSAIEDIDETLPGTPLRIGSLHPLTQLQDRAIQVFRRLGFALAAGPDIDTEWNCFDALNTPPNHPARNETDTFYLFDGRLLRTHTSTVQIRTMLAAPPPVRVIAPGAAYRRDEMDATHLSQFNQLEGLYIDKQVSVADLKGTLEYFVRELLGSQVETRMRPHFFPFTEPSYELDVRLPGVNAGRWMELLGCGMVDPNVLQKVNEGRGDRAYDPEIWSGYAFGMGLDRLAMTLFSLPDIRLLIENDQRFLAQFS
ncbi:MAG TPA: phenylalanine--tRNA ligase subunit alpha [Chthoniobacterales bacterium]|jgi:phenylalanyl-tRNA synthetase alpha chain